MFRSPWHEESIVEPFGSRMLIRFTLRTTIVPRGRRGDNWGMTQQGNSYAQGPYQPAPGAGPQPPVIPFWPLTFGQLFSGTFSAVSKNAGPMFKVAMLATALVGLISGATTAAFSSFSVDTDFWMVSGEITTSTVSGNWFSGFFMEIGASLFTSVAMLFAGAALVISAVNSVIGLNLEAGTLWQRVFQNGWKLIGASILVWLIIGVGGAFVMFAAIGLPGLAIAATDTQVWPWIVLMVIAVLAAIALMIWASVRLLFVTQIVAVEGTGPIVAIRRSWALTKGAFWRTFGRYILFSLIVGAILSVAIMLVTMLLLAVAVFAEASPWLITFLITFISMLLAGATMPYTSSYIALMYTDARIRNENLAPALAAAYQENIT